MELSVKDKGENARTIADGNIVGIGGRGQGVEPSQGAYIRELRKIGAD